jgi:glucose-1-phosphate thymidylyltransferase
VKEIDAPCVFLKRMQDPRRFGVPRMRDGRIVDILEKPHRPPTPYAITGLYSYPPDVFDIIRTLKPSRRGELEISEVNAHYAKRGLLEYRIVTGFWSDAGTPDSFAGATAWASAQRAK